MAIAAGDQSDLSGDLAGNVMDWIRGSVATRFFGPARVRLEREESEQGSDKSQVQ
jgi:hypothetical protein